MIHNATEGEEKNEVSKSHRGNLQKASVKLCAEFGDRSASDVQRYEIVRWLNGMDVGTTTKDWVRRYATSIFAYAADNGYVEANPCHGIDKMAKKRDIDILTVEEVDRLLRECDPKMGPPVRLFGELSVATRFSLLVVLGRMSITVSSSVQPVKIRVST